MSAFLDRIVARTLDAPSIHRRREPLDAMPAVSAPREVFDAEFDVLGEERAKLPPVTPPTNSADPAHRTPERTATNADDHRDVRAAMPERDIVPAVDARTEEPRRVDAPDRGRSASGAPERLEIAPRHRTAAEHAAQDEADRFTTEPLGEPPRAPAAGARGIEPLPVAGLAPTDASADFGESHVRWVDAEAVTDRRRAVRPERLLEARNVDDLESVERRPFHEPDEALAFGAERRSITPEFVERTSLRHDRTVAADDAARTGLDDALTINVSIGRIEVGHPAPVIAPPAARPVQPRPSLGDYMRLREKIRAR